MKWTKYLVAVATTALMLVGCGGDDSPTPDGSLPDGSLPDGSLPDATPDGGDGGGIPVLTPEEYASAQQIYFDRCAGCHGLLRAGATGPELSPAIMQALGTTVLEAMLTNGTSGGMPAFGADGILTAEEIRILAIYLLLDPPQPPPREMPAIMDSWNEIVRVADRPTAPETTRNWRNFMGVILRDAGQVAIVDGDTFEMVAVLDTGYAVHILRSSATGRYFYSVGRDGRVTMIDLWPATPVTVAEVQGCSDARSVDSSKFDDGMGTYDDRYLIEGCYWPAQYVVFNGLTLEPLARVDVPLVTIDGETLEEVRVAAIVSSHNSPTWVMNLKETGYVAIVDYSMPGFPITSEIATATALHDGGWDSTGNFFMTAANASETMVIVDTTDNTLEAMFRTGARPHPGRGANWTHPQFGLVNATTHIGAGLMSIYTADPTEAAGQAWPAGWVVPCPDTAAADGSCPADPAPPATSGPWQVVQERRDIPVGGLFIKTHPLSDHVWMDATLNSDAATSREVCVYTISDPTADLTCWSVADHGRAVHFEYSEDGSEVWVSVWDTQGELVIYNDADLSEAGRITNDGTSNTWLVTPTGKFGVNNTALDIY